jgi:hypothetical protein
VSHGKINLCLQFWEGDRDRAMRLARFIADLEPEKNLGVEFTFVARFDAQHDEETIRYCAHKFNAVHQLTGRRKETGWPDGCNALALDLFQQSAEKFRTGKWKHIKAIYLLESDVMPLRRDWLSALSAEWDESSSRGKLLLGSWCPWHGKQYGHLNGNMLCVPDIASRIDGIAECPPKKAWDAHFAPAFAPHWTASRQMQNHYDHRQNIPEAVLFSSVDGVSEPVVSHGTKDFSAERLVRERLGL